MANEKNYLGLDIGTNSVGWAVTDENYKLRKFKNNLMWGVHLFDEANQSAERRSFRTARRRLDRRQQRIVLLQELFAAEIAKKDPKFFLRLKESALLPEDCETRTRNIFFDDKDYGDKEYFEEYPTIHHLICHLMDDPSPHDIRLVYYACAYLLAHRGHFLFSADKNNVDKITEFSPIYDAFYTSLQEIDDNPPFDPDAEGTAEILKKHVSSSVKEKELKTLLFGGKAPENDYIKYDKLPKLLSGNTVKLSELFDKEEYIDLEKNSVSIKAADFSDTLEMLAGQIDENHLALLSSAKAMYDWSLLVDILAGNKMISESKVKIYDTHKEDLKNLKHLVRSYLSSKEYNEIFKVNPGKTNYASYVYNASSDDDRNGYKKCNAEDFCKFLKTYLEKIKPSAKDADCYNDVKSKCDNGELCPKQVTTDNRVIPYQLYYAELKKILDNASSYLPFLKTKDEFGTVSDKILAIMEFRIPYYVGPLVGKERSSNAWLERKAEGKIYPWNFSKIVNEDASENIFIRRMTCKCTYLAGEDVLPKYSLLYCKFNVLNEINNIKVNGEPISVELKQRLYTDKFLHSDKKVTKKRIAEYFRSIGAYSGEIEISGIDDNVKSSLKPYHDFKNLLEKGLLTEKDIEKIIVRITVSQDSRRLKNWLKEYFGKLSGDDIKYISRLKYNDYGRLSEKFLEELYPASDEQFSDKNIITMLWERNDNLMKLLSSSYGYYNAIERFNRDYYAIPDNQKTISERLKDMYIPTAVRRSVTRTLDIVKELKTILKSDPDKIFIEMARGEGETPKGKRTQSRREQITKFLAEAEDSSDLLKQLENTDDGKLRSEKYYLYFMQLGKCAYTGKSINIEDLEDNQKWNIDHIWPQAKIKDDSLENKVLVDSKANGDKSDDYPIAKEIREKMAGFWKALYSKKLMSEKKYQRLTRSTPFTNEELAGFIARQLVETRQSTKAVATLLKECFPNSEIVYVKAGIVSDFRQEMNMLKCREVNDLHHAKDAYLNIVMGNVYNTKFTSNPLNFINSNQKYSMKLFKKDQNGKESGLLTGIVKRGNTTAWDHETSFDVVRSTMAKNSIRFVKYTFKRKGGLFNQMPERKKEGLVPRKNGLDPEKYGGYNNKSASYFSLVKCSKNSVVIIPVETMFAEKFEKDLSFARKYASDQLTEILAKDIVPDSIAFPLNHRILKVNTVLEVDGFRCNIVQKSNKGRTIVLSSSESLIIPEKNYNYVKKICSFLEKSEKGKKFTVNSYSGITAEDNTELFDAFIRKMSEEHYKPVLSKISEKIKKNRATFVGLDLTQQAIALYNIMNLMKTGRSTGCDLKLVNESAQAGVITMNSDLSKIKDKKSIRIIDQSPTGLFEKKSVNLLEL